MLYSLSSLRFFFAFAIYIHHLGYKTGIGPVAVSFFFVLSGFLIAFGYRGKFQELNVSNYSKFMLNRFSRIYPLHLLAFFIGIYIVYLTGFKTNWLYAVMNLCLLQTYAYVGNQVFSFSGISWFIADCMFFYAITPFLLFAANKIKGVIEIKTLILCEILLFGCGFAVAYIFRGNVVAYSPGWWFIYISPYNRLFDFSIGLIGGLIFTLLNEQKQKCSFLLFSILECGVIAIGYLVYRSSFFPIDSLRYDMFFVPTILLSVFVFAFQGGFLSKVLSAKFFIKLGDLSFSIFMIHIPCITLTAHVLGGRIYGAGGRKHFLGQMLLFVAILCMADVLNRYYEGPAKIWIKKIVRT